MEEEVVDRVSPMFWGLFSVGGFLVALLLPVFIVMNSLAYPFHLVPADRVTFDGARAFLAGAPLQGGPLSVLAPWLAKLFLVVLVGGCLFHGTHRLKFMLMDAGFKGPAAEAFLDLILNGVAILGSLGALFYAVRGWLF